VIKSFLSLAFFNPAKAILVPGMYFLGFSNRVIIRSQRKSSRYNADQASPMSRLTEVVEQGLVLPYDSLVNVGSGVRETLYLTGLSAKETVEVGSDLKTKKVDV
jgi:hypothetical protein